MRKAGPNKQGYLDGLCGIYALTNFLRDWQIDGRLFCFGENHEERSEDAFWLLLDVAERLGMLRADYILRGYAPHHLVRMWNTLSAEADLQSEAVLVSKLKRLGNKLSNYNVLECVLSEKHPNAVVILRNNHWLLASDVGNGGTITIIDSDSREGRTNLSQRAVNEESVEGFAILAEGSKILDCVRKQLDA